MELVFDFAWTFLNFLAHCALRVPETRNSGTRSTAKFGIFLISYQQIANYHGTNELLQNLVHVQIALPEVLDQIQKKDVTMLKLVIGILKDVPLDVQLVIQ